MTGALRSPPTRTRHRPVPWTGRALLQFFFTVIHATLCQRQSLEPPKECYLVVTALTTNAALLLIDLQVGIHHPRLGRRNNPEAELRMGELLAAWRQSGRPVVHVRHLSRSVDSVFWPGQSGCEFQPAFTPLANETVFDKHVPDAFANSGLERWLHARSIKALVIAGVITNNSVEASARSAGNLGFDVVVVEDACFTFDQHDLQGRLWPAEDVHALSLSNLAMDYARILCTEQVLTDGALQVSR